MISRVTLLLAATATLAACTSAQATRERQQARAATEFLERQGSIADPGRVAAADFAFAKMAREDGLWTAFREYAADDAVMDAPTGYASASELLAGREDPAEPIQWAPTDVWSSCDGTLAVTLGRFLRPNGLVGDYVTVWELQSDNSYKWIYDTGTPDDPQPPAPDEEDIPEGAIVVPGLSAITGRVADCPGDTGMPVPAAPVGAAGSDAGEAVAADGTLRADWSRNPGGSRTITVRWLRERAWETASELMIPASD
ncbi:hypothetical protein [Aurantiacibacter poecillastricola]|uniref:hypothetical protein n=1 Tax=Aurantiacibacter poecillastricola TaxID=3064385 RepID=UPI00273F37A3|nr:hypothetical protein [Aurantiacibacter sp. 219JJ12-13]MDP5260835.1 hypothetical protein [Aurantiacibacter sp. 219JJ12-13]